MEEVRFSLSRFREGRFGCSVPFKRYEGREDLGFGANGNSEAISRPKDWDQGSTGSGWQLNDSRGEKQQESGSYVQHEALVYRI